MPRRFRRYRFGISHLIALSVVLIVFQISLSYSHSESTSKVLARTMELYRQDSAERVSDLTATSLELLIDQSLRNPPKTEVEVRKIIQGYNTILSLQALQQNVETIDVLVTVGDTIVIVDEGVDLYKIFFLGEVPIVQRDGTRDFLMNWYAEVHDRVLGAEQIVSRLEGERSVHVLVPFMPRGDYRGAVYLKLTPDFSNITAEIYDTFDQSGAFFSALILISLMALFYLSSYIVEERDVTRELLYTERERQIKQEVEHEKEAHFTRRIYHTHHKAEKIMGFIKEDLRSLDDENLFGVRDKVMKYANYVSRVIYDMKSYNPPMHVIRNQAFRTDLNSVIRFLNENLFSRVYRLGDSFSIQLNFDENVPPVAINEYVIWEIIEPLIQNCIDHNAENNIQITIATQYFADEGCSLIEIMDDGDGIPQHLLSANSDGVKRLFVEHSTTKDKPGNRGYGCYLAYENANRCGWTLDARNLDDVGCCFTIKVPHTLNNERLEH